MNRFAIETLQNGFHKIKDFPLKPNMTPIELPF